MGIRHDAEPVMPGGEAWNNIRAHTAEWATRWQQAGSRRRRVRQERWLGNSP